MGALNNASGWISRRTTRALGASLAILALAAGPAVASERPDPTRSGGPVSTSPESPADAPETRSEPLGAVARSQRPLTRAAVRLERESISPLRWLDRFGPVRVERRP